MAKMIVSDYDRTFYLSNDDIELNKMCVNKFKEQGNIFVIATGRSYDDFMKVKNRYNIYYDYAICDHGAFILDKNNNIIDKTFIPDHIVTNIKNDLKLENDLEYFCCSLKESRVDLEYKNLTKINVKYRSKEEAFQMNDFLNNKYQNYINSCFVNINSIEITSNKVNKANSIKYLINLLNIGKENVYTIGDGYNDIEMIKEFNGYCINGAVTEAKENAIQEYDSVSLLIMDVINNKI